MKSIGFTHQAAKDLDNLPAEARDSVLDGLAVYATTGSGDVKRLQGSEFLRLRIGRYRVIFDEDRTTMLAIQIGKRDAATYRRF